MKKTFTNAVCRLLGLLTLISVSSCSNNNYDSIGYGNNASLKGTKWSASNWDYSASDDWFSALDEDYLWLFYSDTHGLLYYIRKDFDTDNGSSRERVVSHFTYTVKDNQVELKYITYPSCDVYSLTLQGDILSAHGFEYHKGAMNYSDSNWITTICGNTGSCQWYHDLQSSLWIVGDGNMGNYTSYNETPWARNNRHVSTVIVRKGVTSIGDYAFNSRSIGEIELPVTISNIGTYAFAKSCISSIYLSDRITSIPDGAFSDCSYLSNVHMPYNIEKVGMFAFSGCKDVSLYNTKKLRSIGDYAFNGCTVTTWTESDVLESIGHCAVSDCKFYEVKLPDSLKELKHLAFSSQRISTIHIGSGLANVSGTPFFTATQGSMYIDKNAPISLSDDIVDPDHVNKWTLYVPKGSKSAYSKASYWKNFGTIAEDGDLNGDGTVVEEDNNNDDTNHDNNNDSPYVSGSVQGHDYVDLGLSVKWATCNVGAKAPAQYGNYYAWGETYTKDDYTSHTYQWRDYDTEDLTYNNILKSDYDVAYQSWGDKWRMPTHDEYMELIEKCTYTDTTQNNVKGLKIKGSNGKYIFLPYGGQYYANILDEGISYGQGRSGWYWTSTLNNRVSSYLAYFGRDWFGTGATYSYEGLLVRPVTE